MIFETLPYHRCSTQESCSGQLWTSSNGMSGNEECPRGNIIDDIIISTEDVPYDVSPSHASPACDVVASCLNY